MNKIVETLVEKTTSLVEREAGVRFRLTADGACQAHSTLANAVLTEDQVAASLWALRAAHGPRVTGVAGFPYPVGPDGWTTIGCLWEE